MPLKPLKVPLVQLVFPQLNPLAVPKMLSVKPKQLKVLLKLHNQKLKKLSKLLTWHSLVLN